MWAQRPELMHNYAVFDTNACCHTCQPAQGPSERRRSVNNEVQTRLSSERTLAAVVCASRCQGTTCPSGPTASRATRAHARSTIFAPRAIRPVRVQATGTQGQREAKTAAQHCLKRKRAGQLRLLPRRALVPTLSSRASTALLRHTSRRRSGSNGSWCNSSLSVLIRCAAPRCYEVRVAYGCAQHNQPSFFQLHPQLSDTGWRRTAGTAVHIRV